MDLGEQLLRLRRSAGLTQVQVATKMNVAQSVVSHVERGERGTTTETMLAWIEACGGRLVIEGPGGADVLATLPDHERALVMASRQLDAGDQAKLATLAACFAEVSPRSRAALVIQLQGMAEDARETRRGGA